jgi:hypothetical protein
MKRIIELAEQTLVHVQKENYQSVREVQASIYVHMTKARQQLNALEFTKAQGKIEADADTP